MLMYGQPSVISKYLVSSAITALIQAGWSVERVHRVNPASDCKDDETTHAYTVTMVYGHSTTEQELKTMVFTVTVRPEGK